MAKRKKKTVGPWPGRLRELAVRLNLSHPKLAKELGISLRTLRSWLYGERIPTGTAAKLIECRLRETAP